MSSSVSVAARRSRELDPAVPGVETVLFWRDMKIRSLASILLLTVLSGCTDPQYNQEEADLIACELYETVTSQYSLQVEDFRIVRDEAKDLLDEVSQKHDSLASRIDRSLWEQPDTYIEHTALQILGGYDSEEYEAFVSNHMSTVNDCSRIGVEVPTDFLADGQPSPKPAVAVETSNPKVDLGFPGGWSSTEKEIFTLFVDIYPASGNMSLAGKRALMDNSSLICEAYGAGYSRREIQSVTSGGAFTAAMSDDWMSLSVTYLCPQYLDLQMGY